MSDEILNIIRKNKELLKDKEYVKHPLPEVNIYKSLDKMKEVSKIYKMNVDTNYKILKLKHKYKKELENFKYLSNVDELGKDKYFIRYVNINNKFGFGGFLYKYDKNCMTLINSAKKPWNILIDYNFIWYIKAKTGDDKKRDEFIKYLQSIEQK